MEFEPSIETVKTELKSWTKRSTLDTVCVNRVLIPLTELGLIDKFIGDTIGYFVLPVFDVDTHDQPDSPGFTDYIPNDDDIAAQAEYSKQERKLIDMGYVPPNKFAKLVRDTIAKLDKNQDVTSEVLQLMIYLSNHCVNYNYSYVPMKSFNYFKQSAGSNHILCTYTKSNAWDHNCDYELYERFEKEIPELWTLFKDLTKGNYETIGQHLKNIVKEMPNTLLAYLIDHPKIINEAKYMVHMNRKWINNIAFDMLRFPNKEVPLLGLLVYWFQSEISNDTK